MCQNEVNDLHTFAQEAAAPVPVPVAAPQPVKTPWLVMWREWLTGLQLPTLQWAGAAATLLLLAIGGWWLYRTMSATSPRQEIAVSSPTPALLPSSSPVTASPTPGDAKPDPEPLSNDQLARDLGTVHFPAYLMKKGAGGTAMGGSSQDVSTLKIKTPYYTAVEAPQPHIIWTEIPAAVRYACKFFSSQYVPLSEEANITRLDFKPLRPLPAGSYNVEVTAYDKEGQVITFAVSRFIVLSANQRRTITEAKTRYRNAPQRNLLMGKIYGEAGLFEKAEQEYRTALKDRSQAAIAQKQLNRLQQLRGF